MKRVYVAGAYSADNVIMVLDNIKNGMRLSTQVFLAGYAPFCPWFDFHYQLMLRDNEHLTVKDYYNYSIAWLEVSDCLLIGDWPECEHSYGTKKEIERAIELGIPIYRSLQELINAKH